MSWLITINDTHDANGSIDNAEVETVAEVEGSENDYTIFYDEKSEEMQGCHTAIHVTDGRCVCISRTGSYSTELRMEKGKRNQCAYITPVGQFTMGVYASRVISEYSDKRIKLDFSYTLDFNNELMSKNRVKIEAEYKEAN